MEGNSPWLNILLPQWWNEEKNMAISPSYMTKSHKVIHCSVLLYKYTWINTSFPPRKAAEHQQKSCWSLKMRALRILAATWKKPNLRKQSDAKHVLEDQLPVCSLAPLREDKHIQTRALESALLINSHHQDRRDTFIQHHCRVPLKTN